MAARKNRASAPAPSETRSRVAAALQRCSSEERAVLALMLFERMSAPEAADALGVSQEQVEKTYTSLLHDLRDAGETGTFRRSTRRTTRRSSVRKAA